MGSRRIQVSSGFGKGLLDNDNDDAGFQLPVLSKDRHSYNRSRECFSAIS